MSETGKLKRMNPVSFAARARPLVQLLLLALVLLAGLRPALAAHPSAERPPNVVLIFCDDMAYADVGCYGARGYKTPNIDQLARQGVRFTDFYVAQAVCSASRAALLTGCYPNRIGIQGALGPQSKTGIHSNEVTIAELLKQRGYATAIYGKWHLGHQPQFLPPRHGFDDYFGLPYSNDMWPHHPTSKTNYPPLPLIEGEQTVQLMPDQTQLTTWYTERAVGFIERNKDHPFFLYVPHAMPHVPLFVSEKFRGKSKRGLFGDVIQEIDWSVGQILAALKQQRLDENTLVIFTSDNGPWLSYGDHAGSAGRLREGKGTTFEGGVRVPFIARWPGKIPAASVCREPAMTIDLLPTLAKAAGAELPPHPIDGLDHPAAALRPARSQIAARGAALLLGRTSPGGAQRTVEAPLRPLLCEARASRQRGPARHHNEPEDRPRAVQPRNRSFGSQRPLVRTSRSRRPPSKPRPQSPRRTWRLRHQTNRPRRTRAGEGGILNPRLPSTADYAGR